MMKIALIGATGFVGSAILKEAIERDHQVIAVSRLRKAKKHKNIKIHQETIFNKEALLKAIKDVDVIISAYNPGYFHVDQHNRFLQGYEVLVDVAKTLNKKLVMILSATSLNLPNGAAMDEDLSYPAVFKSSMSGPKAIYDLYVQDQSFKWTMVSPAAILFNGHRTKNYVIDTNTIVLDNLGDSSKISVQDLAYAVMNEVEDPKYINQRFTLGYK